MLYCVNVRSSITAPLRDIDPFILLFAKSILSFSIIASSLEILIMLSFCSKLGASEFFSILFFSETFCDLGIGSGAKNNE